MKELIEKFSQQLLESLSIGKKARLSFGTVKFSQVVVSGLGGSGIGGSIVQEYVFDKLAVPLSVNKHYAIPKSVNKDTLFIACSYSGNTEETLQAVSEAKKAKATIVCITSGGALAVFATKNKIGLIEIPSEMPPRACLGYSLVQLLYVLRYSKLLKTNFEDEIHAGIKRINKETKAMQKQAKAIAENLVDKQVAIYSMAGREGLAIRFRQQLNENSKILAWSNVIPEMTHNEIVGWRAENKNIAVLYCYHPSDFAKNIERLNVLKKVIGQYNSNSSDIVLKGESYFEQAIYFIHLTDWISFYLSELNQHDPMEVKVIDVLKSKMAKK